MDAVLETSGLYYPNRIARAFFIAMEEVMGRHGLSSLLSLAELDNYVTNPPPDNLDAQFDFAHMAALNQALEQMYGVKGGRGIALRIGRASFAQGLKRFGAMKGIADPAFRALPLHSQMDIGLRGLAAIFTNFSDQESQVEITEDELKFIVSASPMAWGRTTEKPVCHALAGIIQECLRWSSNGMEFYVREIACQATGDHDCIFRVSRQALGSNFDE